jgi:predicted GH43/DUF377 family glycosyl hydrolase
MKKWVKYGKIFCPEGKYDWAVSHAANPVAENIEGDIFRIYFSTRDKSNRSSIGSIIISLSEPHKIIEESSEPVLKPGELAMFDDSGVSIGCIIKVGSLRYLYYMGWNLTVTVPWKNSLGLAISEDVDKPFKRYSRFPIIDLNEIDPYTISYPWVMKENGVYRMWYGSNLKWGANQEDMNHILKYAESKDGINWKRYGQIVIDSNYPKEYAICKPCVLKQDNDYYMWYSSRGHRYRIFWAKSKDGITWEKLGKDTRIDVSEQGWDSDMIEYPFLFEHNEKLFMLYAGNGYGKAGIGLAFLD